MTTPHVSRHTSPLAPKHVVFVSETCRSDRVPENADAPAAMHDPENKKAREILADLPGYLAVSRTSIIDDPAKFARYVHHATAKN
jgi:hypothetical protein